MTTAIAVLFLLVGCDSPPQVTQLVRVEAAPVVEEKPAPTATTAVLAAPATPEPAPTNLPTPEPTIPPIEFDNPLHEAMAAAALSSNVAFVRLERANSGVWQYPAHTFVHPVSLVVWENRLFLLDGGRVLAIDLATPQTPISLLGPGEIVDGVRVQEPHDLAVDGTGLSVLDRVGDVYHYGWETAVWTLDRYDRPIRDTSSHYFVALAAVENGRFLLETNYKYGMRYTGAEESLWTLPENVRNLDMAVVGESVYILTHPANEPQARLVRYRGGVLDKSFRSFVAIDQARQVVATAEAVYVLDQGGRRLLQVSVENGELTAVYQLPQNDPSAAFAVDPTTNQLVFAGRNRLYFYQQPERWTAVAAEPLFPADTTLPHDPAWLATLPTLLMPIGGSDITARDLQLPGAPRHYRLGIHAGLDFYWQTGTAVRAVATGTVLRATHDFVPPAGWEFEGWYSQTLELTYTSPEALDFYRGRQVWIAHDNGLVSRYVHLNSIDPALVEGKPVVLGQIIGTVGNSGSPASQISPTEDAHLHFELWHGNHYVGQFLRPVEAREWFERLFVNE
ncbi:MAG: M23 family metallopeptidase [Chloroflexota bacterium]